MGAVISLVSVFAVVSGVGFGDPAFVVISLGVICFVRAGVGCGGFVWFLFCAWWWPWSLCGGEKSTVQESNLPVLLRISVGMPPPILSGVTFNIALNAFRHMMIGLPF